MDKKLNEYLTELITLGERSDAGYEKIVVLDELEQLMEKIQTQDKYSGNYLESILRVFDKIVTGKDKPGNESDFNRAIDILEKIIKKFSTKDFPSEGDKILVYWSLTEIGKRASELRFNKSMQRAVDASDSNADSLFDIGLSAFRVNDYFIATIALSKLETLAMKPPEDKGQCISDLLGLLAHFWTGNQSSRRYVQEFLSSPENKFSPLEQYLDRAIEDHYNASRFDTADKLMTMKDDLLGKGRII